MFISLQRIAISNANAQSAYSVVSGISPLAYLGFSRKLALNYIDQSCHNIKVSIIHHDATFQGEYAYDFIPAQLKGQALTISKKGSSGSNDYAGNSLNMSLQPTARCNTTVSLIIELPQSIQTSENALKNIILGMRIGGGTIQSISKINFYDNANEAISKSSNGYFIIDRSNLLLNQPDILSTFINLLATSDEQVKLPWLSPMGLGYLRVTVPKIKESSRQNFPHFYSEPLIGLVQYLSKRKLIENNEEIPFWRYIHDDNSFYVTSQFI
jgi:CRISPR-associated protein Csy2